MKGPGILNLKGTDDAQEASESPGILISIHFGGFFVVSFRFPGLTPQPCTPLPDWQDAPTMSAGENQFSPTRATPLTGVAAINQIPIISADEAKLLTSSDGASGINFSTEQQDKSPPEN
jgi:hypothetical protein